MVIISDTTPLSNLLQIGRLELLQILYQKVVVPTAVFQELQALTTFQVDIQSLTSGGWLTIRTPKNGDFLSRLLHELDAGEAQAIALAVEMHADYLLIDEKEGRILAETYHIPIIGTLGVLLKAKQANLILEIKPEIDALRQIGFWISDHLYNQILMIAKES